MSPPPTHAIAARTPPPTPMARGPARPTGPAEASVPPDPWLERFIGRCPAISAARSRGRALAEGSLPVLVVGESGTGKSLVAALLHATSGRGEAPLVELACTSLSPSRLADELLGIDTPTTRRPGAFDRAAGGTLVIEEVALLPLPVQDRLLGLIARPCAPGRAAPPRVVATTSGDPSALAAQGLADLLAPQAIHLPPLRQRGKAEIILLAEALAQRFAANQEKRIRRIEALAIDLLTGYHWPGNLRELENVVERAVRQAPDDGIHGHHLPPSLQRRRILPGSPDPGDFATQVAAFEIGLISEALKDAGGNQTRAAERLGLTKRIMQYKIGRYGIDWRRFR